MHPQLVCPKFLSVCLLQQKHAAEDAADEADFAEADVTHVGHAVDLAFDHRAHRVVQPPLSEKVAPSSAVRYSSPVRPRWPIRSPAMSPSSTPDACGQELGMRHRVAGSKRNRKSKYYKTKRRHVLSTPSRILTTCHVHSSTIAKSRYSNPRKPANALTD